jgi:hypothetical protein
MKPTPLGGKLPPRGFFVAESVEQEAFIGEFMFFAPPSKLPALCFF